jgi:hypothetical protein
MAIMGLEMGRIPSHPGNRQSMMDRAPGQAMELLIYADLVDVRLLKRKWAANF